MVKIEGTGKIDRDTVDPKLPQLKKSEEIKQITTPRQPTHMALMTKLVMTSSQPTMKQLI